MTTTNFFQKNQVLLSAIASALALSLQQFLGKPEIEYKALGLAALIAIAGVLGNQLRGKGVTVAGFLGVAATAFGTIQTTGKFTWLQFGIMSLIGFLALVSPPPKNIAYEQSPVITEAKAEAKVIAEAEKKDDPKIIK